MAVVFINKLKQLLGKKYEIFNEKKLLKWLEKRIKCMHSLIDNSITDRCTIECESNPKDGYKILISEPNMKNTLGNHMEVSLTPLEVVDDSNSKSDSESSNMDIESDDESSSTDETTDDSDETSDENFEYDFEEHWNEDIKKYECNYHKDKKDKCTKKLKI